MAGAFADAGRSVGADTQSALDPTLAVHDGWGGIGPAARHRDDLRAPIRVRRHGASISVARRMELGGSEAIEGVQNFEPEGAGALVAAQDDDG